MRKSAKQIGIESRPRIDKTKSLTLNERVAILDGILDGLGLQTPISDKHEKEIRKELIAQGYEPMMFAHAARIIQSRRS
jgi:hypothetical protein